MVVVQKVASVDTSAVELKHLDVVKDSVDQLAATMEGADALVVGELTGCYVLSLWYLIAVFDFSALFTVLLTPSS